jgi:hypothetical protein
MTEDTKKIVKKIKPIAVCSEKINLIDGSQVEVLNDPIEWDDLATYSPLCKHETAESSYIKTIKLFQKRNNIKTDKFYVESFRYIKGIPLMFKYFYNHNYSKSTKLQFISHFIVILESCPYHFSSKDYIQYLKFEKYLNKSKETKITEHSKIEILPWNEMKNALQNIIDENNTFKNKHIRTLAFFLLRGYVLRINIFCDTQLIKDDKERENLYKYAPTLNINTGHFYIPKQKSKGASFYVDDETMKEYKKKYYEEWDTFLLSKNNGKQTKPFAISNFTKEIFKGIHSTSRVRKSFLTYYIMNNIKTMKDIINITSIVGNLPKTAFEKYLQINKDLDIDKLNDDNKQIIEYFIDREQQINNKHNSELRERYEEDTDDSFDDYIEN